MTYNNIKHLSIRDYLKSKGVYPKKEYMGYGMYKSPFREDNKPSLKVDYRRNLWYDFGSGVGGGIIDLVMKIHSFSLKETYEYLSNYSQQDIGAIEYDSKKENSNSTFSFHSKSLIKDESENTNGIILSDVKSLKHPMLLKYLQERKINTVVASKICNEIHYQINGRSYFGIGFKNDNDGYEIRNTYFKGCIVPKDITSIKLNSDNDICYLFEGFMDYLSLLTLQSEKSNFPYLRLQDSIIMNSISNISKALPLLNNYREIHSFLDNDTAGKKVFQELKSKLGLRM